MDDEIWAPVLGYEGIYEASTLGRVRILIRRQNIRAGTILHQSPARDGYLVVRLNRNDGSKTRSRAVSRTVYEAHRGPAPAGLQIDHVNGDRIDNRLANLEAVTCAVNSQRAVERGGRRGERNGSAKLDEDRVMTIRKRAATGERFDHIARDMGVSGVLVAKIAYHAIWTHVGGPRCKPRGRIGRPHA